MERQIILFSAFSGYGKTTVVKELLRKQMYEIRDVRSGEDILRSISSEIETVVIEQTHLIQEQEIQQGIRNLVDTYLDKHFIFLTRSELPRWLIDYQLQGRLMAYHDNLMRLSMMEMKQLFDARGVKTSEKEIQEFYKMTGGYPLTIGTFCCMYEEAESEVPALMMQAVHRVCRYIEEEVFSQCQESVQNLLLSTAQLEEYDIELARIVSECVDVERDIKYLLEESTILGIKSNGSYGYDPLFRAFLVWKMKRTYTKKQQNELQHRVGSYYEEYGKSSQAIQCYTQAGAYEKVRNMLEDNGRKNPSAAQYMEMESAYRGLNRRDILQSPSLMSGMSMLESLRTNFDESEQWYRELKSYGERLVPEDAQFYEVKNAVLFLDIALPHRSNSSVKKILEQVLKLSGSRQLELPEFSITMGGISMMNGGKDFSEWCKIDEVIYRTMTPVVRGVLGREGVGITECGICESKFEKGEAYQKYLVKMMAVYPDIKSKGCLDTEVAFHGILAHISMGQGKIGQARDTLDRILERIPQGERSRYVPNIRAMLCKVALLTGGVESVDAWYLQHAPEDTLDIWLLLRYQYQIKAEVMIQRGRYLEAILILTRVLSYTNECAWHIDEIKCHTLLAISYYRMEDKTWKSHLKQAIKLGESYHFIHTIAQYGVAVFPLLREYPIEKSHRNQEYCEELLEATKNQGILYQSYLQADVKKVAELSVKEMRVLELICQNKSNVEISEILEVKLSTVKTHVSHIFHKLGVNKRSEVKTEARKQNLVDEYLLK